MNEARTTVTRPEDELVDILLDFIIVSANLAKKITGAMRTRQIREGGNQHEQTQRNGRDYRRTANSRCRD